MEQTIEDLNIEVAQMADKIKEEAAAKGISEDDLERAFLMELKNVTMPAMRAKFNL